MSNDEISSNSSSSSDSSTENTWLQNKRARKQALHQFIIENEHLDSISDYYLATNNNLFQQNTNTIPRNRRQYIERNREAGHERLFNDYFSNEPVYPAHVFRRRFRMQKHLFLRLVDAFTTNDQYFQQRQDATGRLGLSPLHKCTAAIRVLAYGMAAVSIDEYMRLSETVVRDSLVHFVEGVISIFGAQYLRRPNEEDVHRLLSIAEQRGFPGMMGSIDCIHWEWKNCPSAWAGQYAGRNTQTTIILEAVASYDLWIWHSFFGTPSSCNDINVLQRSPIFNDILEGKAPKVSFVVNGRQYNMGYYLTDGIYPSWAAFVKSITAPQFRKHKLFAQLQESARKDVERAFGVLQARFAFIKRPCLVWDDWLMDKIMMACIILHNMIVEDKRDTYQTQYDITEFSGPHEIDMEVSQFSSRVSTMSNYMKNRSQIRDRDIHNNLKNDLIEHIWEKFGNNN